MIDYGANLASILTSTAFELFEPKRKEAVCMARRDEPIIKSLMDVDFYKPTMSRVVEAKGHARVPVRYRLICRTPDTKLGRQVDLGQLREELQHVRTLLPKHEELYYLAELPNGLFPPDVISLFRNRIRGLDLPVPDIEVRERELHIEAAGNWLPTIWWETLVLSIVSELRGRYKAKTSGKTTRELEREGKRRLQEKIELLRQHPEIRFMDFGTRRRFSRRWQENVLWQLMSNVPGSLVGTSNVDLARRLHLKPMGTIAHEMFQAYSGIYHEPVETLVDSHNRVLRDWYDVFGGPLSIALTDTYGTRFFWRQFRPEQAINWWGLRHDSADPFAFGEAAIAFYSAHGIDPREKMVVFSENLCVELMIALAERFQGAIGVGFGWGTNLTNDVGLPGLSLAMKMVESSGHGTVKLSDNLNKAVGERKDVEVFKEAFGYSGGTFSECPS